MIVFTMLLGIGVWMQYPSLAGANPSSFVTGQSQGVSAGSATTSPKIQTAGTGTSTPSIDAFSSGTPSAQVGSSGLDGTSLLVQWVGSSTVSTLDIKIECSQDNLDWYEDCVGGNATTSRYALQYASSTEIGGAGTTERPTSWSSASQVNTRIFDINTPLRYVRAVISTPGGSLNNMVWAQFIAKRQAK